MAIAVSGGSDSIALLRLAVAAGLAKITALTVDHGLREGSAAEARQVAGWCQGLGIEHHILIWPGEKPATGIQAKARAARYDLMGAWCGEHGATVLLTAHTMDDQAETVLMRMARTSSFDSLAGIAREGNWKGVRLFRPLLGERREVLRRYLSELGQAWIEDPSNEDPRFERTRVRRTMPQLAAIGLETERLAALADECAGIARQFDALASRWMGYVHEGSGYCTFAALSFRIEAEEVQVRVLACLIRHYGGGSRPQRAELQRLARSMAGEHPVRTLGGAFIWNRGRWFMIGREAARIAAQPVAVPECGEVLWDRRMVVTAPPGSLVFPARLAADFRSRYNFPHFVVQSEPAVRLPDGQVVAVEYHPKPPAHARFLELNSP